jgi:ABC-type nitrate/sulfonate/bicarbonate transport system substrate-binding protein
MSARIALVAALLVTACVPSLLSSRANGAKLELDHGYVPTAVATGWPLMDSDHSRVR